MVAPNNDDEDEVKIRLTFEAEQAAKSLKRLLVGVDDFNVKVDLTKTKLKQLSSVVGVSFEEAAGALKKTRVMAGDTDKVITQALQNVQREVGANTDKWKAWNNVINTVRGTLTALVVFQVIQFIAALGNQFVIAAQQADKLVRAIVDLRNVEKILSESGIEVTMKDLFAIVSRLEEKFRLLSKIDLTELVANAAIATREFGFTPQQIESISEVAALLAETQNIDTKSALEATVRALSGKSQGNNILKQAGIFLNEQVIKHKAIELGLVKEGEILSQNVTATAALVLLQEKSLGLQSQIADLEASDAGRVAAVGKAWEELLTTLGTGFYSLVANASDGLVGLIKFLDQTTNRMKLLVITFQSLLYASRETFRAIQEGALVTGQNLETIFKDNFQAYFGQSVASSFKTPLTADSGIGDERIVAELNKYITAGDTATDTTQDLNEALELTPEQSDKAGKELEDLAEDLQKLGERAEEAQDKYDEAVERAKEDFDTKNLRQLEDYNRDVFELNRDTNLKLAEAQKKHRDREAADERKFQERMLELREKFLFDLEDALHERDARQILRLIRSYNLEKEQEIRKHALENRERAEQNSQELADMRQQAADKMEQLNYEYETRKQRELEDYNEREARRLEDFEREQAQIQEQINARLQAAATALAEELGLNADGQEQIYQLLSAYYKPGGIFDTLYDNSYRSLVAKTQNMVAQLAALAAAAQAQANAAMQPTPVSQGGYINPIPNAVPFASGGMAIADKPTNALFGEKEAELALFIPLSKLASVMGKGQSGSGDQAGPSSANINLEINLSKDLEARIINKSVDAVADVVTTVNRNRK